MKKILSLMVCLLATFTAVQAASTQKCLLQHQGTVKLFDADNIAGAMSAATDGDTLYLTAGEFPGFTISKKITVRGAGTSTKITGDVTINIAGTPTLTQTLLEGVDLYSSSKDVVLSSAMKGVKIKQCSMYELVTNASNSDVIIDRCYIGDELRFSDNYIKSMIVLNSEIGDIGRSYHGQKNTINFINCNIRFYYPYQVAGTFVNCSITRYYNSSESIKNCSFVNCLFKWDASSYFASSTTSQQCYFDATCDWDAATFESLGYMGNDGRVVGLMGGATPYTLELAVPKVTESQISLDPETRVLNVNIKVSAK